MKNSKSQAEVFRNNLKTIGLNEIEGKLSDEELTALMNSAIPSISMSVTMVKKVLFCYIFLNKDMKEIEKTKIFFEAQVETKKEIDIQTKRIITFFIRNIIFKNTKTAYFSFLKTYGLRSRTYWSKVNNPLDFLNFSVIYNNIAKPLIWSIKKHQTKRFNGLSTKDKDNA